MNTQTPDDNEVVAELLDLERELTVEEMLVLRRHTDQVWASLTARIDAKVSASYGVSSPETFRQCLDEHLDQVQIIVMLLAEVYNCPLCGRLLKDRQSSVASAILLERRRVAGMLRDVETAPIGEERSRLWHRLRAGLGL